MKPVYFVEDELFLLRQVQVLNIYQNHANVNPKLLLAFQH